MAPGLGHVAAKMSEFHRFLFFTNYPEYSAKINAENLRKIAKILEKVRFELYEVRQLG